jgi:Protein kinase domain/FG-GAP repeat/FG-GAP-like repeat
MDRTPEDDALLEAAYELTDHAPAPPPPGRAEPAGPLDATSRSLDRMALLADVAAAYSAVGAHDRADATAAAPALFAWGQLRARGRLGEGAFGEVYAAWDPALQREVALKLRRAEAGTLRWLDEARALARVRHPNVLVVHGADLRDGRAGIWSELIRGRTLEEELAASGPLPVREAARIARDVASALDAVHRTGLVHGDVTTRNVMIEDAPPRTGSDSNARDSAPGVPRSEAATKRHVVLMDFGTASDEASTARLGTPYAADPELLEGGKATPASDIYSLGVLLFRMLTGRYPVEASDLAELRARHASGKRLGLGALRRGVPAPVARIVERALQPDPARRYSSAAAMHDALSRALGEFVPIVPASTVLASLGAALVVGILAWVVVHETWRRDARYFAAPPSPRLAISQAPNWTAFADSNIGESASLVESDLDGDGYLDAVVADGAYSLGTRERGRTLIYRGGPGGLSSSPRVLCLGTVQGGRMGGDAACGDVDGDGWPDVIVGTPTPGVDPLTFGEARLYPGTPSGPAPTPVWIRPGEPAWTGFAQPPAFVGDINGDGFGDVIIPERDWSGSHRNQGRVLVFFGSPHGLGSKPDQIITDEALEERFGDYTVGVGDVNGDGYGDVAISASIWPGPHGQTGCVCLFLGGPHGLSPRPAQRISASESDDQIGVWHSFCALGDVNGDGYADVAIGFPSHSGRALNIGEVRVYLGGPDGWQSRAAWRAQGFNSVSTFGIAIAAGDVDGDGRRDLIIGSPGFGRPRESERAGAVFVYRGIGAPKLFDTQPSWWAWSGQPEASFGENIAVGDVNGDGADDILVAAEQWRRGEITCSRIALYLGVPSKGRVPAANRRKASTR